MPNQQRVKTHNVKTDIVVKRNRQIHMIREISTPLSVYSIDQQTENQLRYKTLEQQEKIK